MTPEDFSEMKWRIDLLPIDKNCYEEYVDLAERMCEFSLHSKRQIETLTNDQLLRYIILCYHRYSPFIKKISETKQRKHQALVQVGFKFDIGQVPEDIHQIINNEHVKVADMILKFLSGENSMKFAALMMQTDAYYKYNYQLAYTEVKSIKSLTQAINDLGESIESLSHEVFSGDIELSNFVAGAGTRGLVLSPEMNAHRK